MSAVAALIEVAGADPFAMVRALRKMRAAGFTLELDGRALVASPADKLSAAQRDFIRANKAALVALLEDAEALHHALVVAGHAGLGWQAGTPADWDDVRLLGAGEVLYGDGRMVGVQGRRFAAESAPPGPDISPDIASAKPAPPADPLAARVAELIAQGWSPWNARARARSEALHRTKPGARS